MEAHDGAAAPVGFTDQPTDQLAPKPASKQRKARESTGELDVILAVGRANDTAIAAWLRGLTRTQLDEFQRLVNFRLSKLVSAEVRERNAELRRQRDIA